MSFNNKIGPHVSMAAVGIVNTLNTLPSGCDCFQCFLGAPLTYNVKKLSETEVSDAQKILHERNMTMYVHAPYVTNLANSEKAEAGRNSLQKLLDTNGRISTTHTGSVLHIGANGTLETVADHLNSMTISSPLYLENCAGEGSKLGKSMAELHKLLEATDSYRIGLCIDTCHAHSAGMTDMRNSSSVVKLFEDLPEDRPVMFHLNDSKVAYHAKVDRHMPIGAGTIWSDSKNSLTTFAELSQKFGRDIILETPSLDLNEINWLRSMD
jgi:deoxyribonuclease-4